MNKLVTLINWVNDTDPAINDEHLNQVDHELDALDDRVIELVGDCEEQAEEAEAWAKGTRGGEAVTPEDETYENNSEFYAGEAKNSATAAGNSATNAGNSATAASGSASTAAQKALDSEAWAEGTRNGEAVPYTDPTHEKNSKYHADRAAESAVNAAEAVNQINHTLGMVDFQVNMTTGELEYLTDIPYTFQVNALTGNLEWEVTV